MGRLTRIIFYHFIRTVKRKEEPMGLVTVLSNDTVRVSVRTRQSEQHVSFMEWWNADLQIGYQDSMYSCIALDLPPAVIRLQVCLLQVNADMQCPTSHAL